MKVAIIHYWLVGMRGGERVLERICRLFPSADIFTHVYDPQGVSSLLRARNIKTSFIQSLPFANRMYQKYLPLMPLALEELNLEDYDLVISSEAGPAKGIIPRPDAAHVCYCHSPMRYIWDQYYCYKQASGLGVRLSMPFLAHQLRTWDIASSARVDAFVGNSHFVAQRINKYYRRYADVVHPPVDVDLFRSTPKPEPYFLWVGQLVPYKECAVAIRAFNKLKLPLLVIGHGSEEKKLKRMAAPNISFISSLPLNELRQAYANAQALIFTATEDFGIVPVEAQASGRPVIAYAAGGAMETIIDGETGLLFDERSEDALVEAVELFLKWKAHFDPRKAINHVQQYRPEVFDRKFSALVTKTVNGGTWEPAAALAS